MKTQAKDAVALAMDWLAQLREEDSGGPPAGDGQPATDSVPPAADSGDAAPIAPPAGNFTDTAPAPLPAADYADAGPAAPPVDDSWPAARHAGDFRDADPTAPTAGDSWPAPPRAGDFREPAPPAADWGDAAPPAGDSWWVAAPPAGTAPSGRAGMGAGTEITERAVIGDELRVPLAWCEMGACISRYADPAALGEADIRARAIEAGWRADALGRLACPQCQQGESWFWTAHPAVLWDRDTAVAMTTLMAAAVREITAADGPAGAEPGPPPGGEPGMSRGGEPGAVPGAVPGPRPEMARPPGRGRHRGHPAHADRAR